MLWVGLDQVPSIGPSSINYPRILNALRNFLHNKWRHEFKVKWEFAITPWWKTELCNWAIGSAKSRHAVWCGECVSSGAAIGKQQIQDISLHYPVHPLYIPTSSLSNVDSNNTFHKFLCDFLSLLSQDSEELRWFFHTVPKAWTENWMNTYLAATVTAATFCRLS